jgi:hypothetical protein
LTASQANEERETMDCSITTPEDPTSPTKFFPVEYWYAVEATQNNTSWGSTLEEKIYRIAVERMSFCVSQGQRRLISLEDEIDEPRGRRLGVLSVTSSPSDKIRSDGRLIVVFCLSLMQHDLTLVLTMLEVACPEALQSDDTFCWVVQGKLTIVARESDDLSKTTNAMLTAIEDAMAPSDELLGNDIPTVNQTTFLGTSEDDVANWNPPIAIIPPPANDDNKSALPAIIAVSSVSLLALLLLLLWRQRRKVMSERAFSALNDNSNFYPLPGTGDPPGSFHHGMYHYFREGQAYLSTNCPDCHDTRLNGINEYYNGLIPISEDEEMTYNRLIMANSKDLGLHHSGIDVHKCASSMCKLCRPYCSEVDFERLGQKEKEALASKAQKKREKSARNPDAHQPIEDFEI